MMKLVFLGLAFLFSTVAHADPSQGDFNKSLELHGKMTLVSVDAIGAKCDAPLFKDAQNYVDEENRLVSRYISFRQSGTSVGQLPTDYILKTIRDYGSQDALRLAKAMLREKCLDGADHNYREILANYSDRESEAVRQQAMVGIDDVRAARSVRRR